MQGKGTHDVLIMDKDVPWKVAGVNGIWLDLSGAHAVALRKINNTWYLLDNWYAPWEPLGGKRDWAQMNSEEDWQYYHLHTQRNTLLNMQFISKSRIDRGHEAVVRGFVQKRRHAKATLRGRQHKACGGRDVPVTSYTYKPTPAQSNCKSIQLKYGPGCKTYGKCISEATQWKMRGDEALSHF